MAPASATGYAELTPTVYRGFFGGLNVRDAPNELAPGESPDLWNVVLDERGGFGSRLGMIKWNSSPFPNPIVGLFEWQSHDHVVVQAGAKVYLDSPAGLFKTFTTAQRCGFAEFGGKLWIIHPVDGLFQSDGTSGGTAVVPTGPKGSTLAVWQGRLWASGNSARVYFSSIGNAAGWTPASTTTAGGTLALPAGTITVASTTGFDPNGSLTVGTGDNADTVSYTGITATTFTGCTGGSHSWPSGTTVAQGSNYNDLIEKDEEPVVCLKGASGQNQLGQPGLVAFKRRSAYRIYDPATGAYVTIDPEVGCASNASAEVSAGRVYTISEAGICWTDGKGPMRLEGDKLRPLWSDQQLAYDRLDLWVAGRHGTKLTFSVPTQGKTACDLAFEHYPAQNPRDAATVIGSNAASCYLSLTDDEDTLIAGSPSVSGQVYKLNYGGTDDGAPIHAWYQTAWFAPHGERMSRIRSVVFEGRGTFTAYGKQNFSRAQGNPHPVSIALTGLRWNHFHWNDGSRWGPDSFAAFSDPIASLGCVYTGAFRIEATTTTTKPAPGLTGIGIPPIVGAWGVYAIHVKSAPLRQL